MQCHFDAFPLSCFQITACLAPGFHRGQFHVYGAGLVTVLPSNVIYRLRRKTLVEGIGAVCPKLYIRQISQKGILLALPKRELQGKIS